MMPLHYNRTAVVDGTASVHHRLGFMMGCFMDCRAVMDRAAFVYSRVLACTGAHSITRRNL